MKKLLFVALIALILGACGSNSNSPSKTAEKIAEAMKNGDYKTVVDNFYFEAKEGGTQEEIDSQKQMLESILKEKGGESMKKKGGIKSYEVVEETIAEDGETATVKMKYTYNNDTEDTEDMSFVKKDGKWYLEMNK